MISDLKTEYKDGRPYPWSLDLSTLVIFPESANQTIYTANVRHGDSGNYTCVLRDDQRNHDIIYSHKTILNVFDKAPDDPKITFISPDMIPHTGDSLRLFCEAFGGTVDLPDAYNEAVWHKELADGTLIKLPKRLYQEKTLREDGQTFGTYLKFESFQLEDAGTYVCVISKPGVSVQKRVSIRDAAVFYIDPNPFPWKQITIACLIVSTLIMSIIVLNRKYGPKVKALVKDNCYAIEDYDGKTNDVLIAYSAEDTELANGIMLPKLETRSYTCTSRKITCDITRCAAEISQYAESSRRIIVILSPAALNDIWTSAQLYQVLKHFQTINTCKIVYVTVRSFPVSGAEVKNNSGESLRSLMSKINIIQWNVSKDANFWFRLCRELPPKRSKYRVKSKSDGMLA
ncbi:hypothetical protein HUJ05_003654 [Dendroctonus ponderosae]|nr:hypothetical protein HUJ05_003654 [Dendroctonus ponderosae]